MKKIYSFTLTYLFLSLLSNAQSTYHKMLKEDTTTWQHFGFLPGVESNGKTVSSSSTPVIGVTSYAAIDTISFGGTKYKKFYLLTSWGNQIFYGNKSLAGFLREDTITKRVYYRESASTSDLLLYDFGLNVNDSTFLSFPNNSAFSGYYRVDSIVVKNEICGPRKHFFYRKHSGNSTPNHYYYENIESIGSTYHIAYIFTYFLNSGMWPAQFFPGCVHKWDIGMSCKHDDEVNTYVHCSTSSSYWNFHMDICSFYLQGGGLKTNDLENLIEIGPNPNSDILEVHLKQSFSNISFSIADMTGKTLIQIPKSDMVNERSSLSISTKELASGIYILQVKINESILKKPIIVQH